MLRSGIRAPPSLQEKAEVILPFCFLSGWSLNQYFHQDNRQISMQVVIIDYGAGNVHSVQNACQRLGVDTIVTGDKETIQAADKVIFPGVGHARSAMEQIHKLALADTIRELKQPVLGICLGMQLMCSWSEEGGVEGLHIFDAKVLRFPDGLKVPQIGWNQVQQVDGQYRQFNKEYFYFVHSYYVPVNDATVLQCEYGLPFSAGMRKDNFTAMQFHPEKSGAAGERLLQQFLSD
jgi:glutamine amidotransferase